MWENCCFRSSLNWTIIKVHLSINPVFFLSCYIKYSYGGKPPSYSNSMKRNQFCERLQELLVFLSFVVYSLFWGLFGFFLHLSLVRWSRNVPLIRVYCCEKYVGCIGFVFCFEVYITGFQTNCAQLQPGFIVLRIILALELKRIHLQLDAQIETHNHISHNAIFLI